MKKTVLILLSFTLLTYSCSLQGTGQHREPQEKIQKAEEEQKKKEREEWEQRIVTTPMLITSDYFRQKSSSDTSKQITIFGGSSSKREKELEERLAALEKRFLDLPDRPKDQKGSPILRRKVVLLSLLGDTGLDVLSLLPSALKRTNGIIPVESEQFTELLRKSGKKIEDLASNDVRKEIALKAGIQAFIVVYFPYDETVTSKENKNKLRIDLINALDSTLISSYYSSVDDFDSISKLISDDVIRSISWSGRIIQIENNTIYINSGRLTGLQPGDRLKVISGSREIYDPLTGRIVGTVPGEVKGEIQIESLFGTDGATAKIISGKNFNLGDIVEISGLM